MRGKHRRMTLMAALTLALMAGAACARNSEDDTAVGAAPVDSVMGRDTSRIQTGRADTSWAGQPDTSMVKRDTTSTMQRDTTSTMSNPSSTSSNTPSTGSTTSDPGSTSTGSTTTTTTPQASGPSAAGYSYEPSVAAPWAAATGAEGRQQLTDATILAVLDRADMADSAAGAVAMRKAANPQVKDFGRMMTRDHHESHVKVMKLAKSMNVTVQGAKDHPISVTADRDATTLASTPSGEQFDRTYIEQQVAMHQQVIDFTRQAEQSTRNEQLKQHIQTTGPVLQRHLQRAQELQQSLGRMPT